jgi:hypothetical protein
LTMPEGFDIAAAAPPPPTTTTVITAVSGNHDSLIEQSDSADLLLLIRGLIGRNGARTTTQQTLGVEDCRMSPSSSSLLLPPILLSSFACVRRNCADRGTVIFVCRSCSSWLCNSLISVRSKDWSSWTSTYSPAAISLGTYVCSSCRTWLHACAAGGRRDGAPIVSDVRLRKWFVRAGICVLACVSMQVRRLQGWFGCLCSSEASSSSSGVREHLTMALSHRCSDRPEVCNLLLFLPRLCCAIPRVPLRCVSGRSSL